MRPGGSPHLGAAAPAGSASEASTTTAARASARRASGERDACAFVRLLIVFIATQSSLTAAIGPSLRAVSPVRAAKPLNSVTEAALGRILARLAGRWERRVRGR